MKHYETVTVPAHLEEKHVRTTCDLCGDAMVDLMHERDEVSISIERRKSDHAYPEAEWGEVTRMDICGKCFESKLIPFLKSQGAVPEVKEYDY